MALAARYMVWYYEADIVQEIAGAWAEPPEVPLMLLRVCVCSALGPGGFGLGHCPAAGFDLIPLYFVSAALHMFGLLAKEIRQALIEELRMVRPVTPSSASPSSSPGIQHRFA